ETRSLMYIADAIGLLKGSKSWKDSDQRAMQQWYADYLKWLLTSKNGGEEHRAKNNHGTWYYAQVIDFALFSGNRSKAIQLVEESKKRLDSQITREGKQPLELERTNALGYSTMNLDGWFTVAKLAKHVKVDLWNYKSGLGVGFRDALDWLIPFALGRKKFEYQQIHAYDKGGIYPLLLQAGFVYNDEKYVNSSLVELGPADKDWLTDLLFSRGSGSTSYNTLRVLTYNIHHANPPSKTSCNYRR
ncbi:MAG: alginate lyase family protein, partial [Chitinophagaceae bacterium]